MASPRDDTPNELYMYVRTQQNDETKGVTHILRTNALFVLWIWIHTHKYA